MDATARVSFGGLNIDNSENETGLRTGQNIEILPNGWRKRTGWESLAEPGTFISLNTSDIGITSLFQYFNDTDGTITPYLFFCEDGNIWSVDLTTGLFFDGRTSLIDSLGAGLRVSWAALNNRAICTSKDNDVLLWTDGTVIYPNGVAAPAAVVASQASTGSLVDGVYRVAVSYVRSGDYGFETNASTYTEVTVSSGPKKISITLVASDDTQIDKINIYASLVDGTVLYYQTQVSNTDGTYDLTSVVSSAITAPETNYVIPVSKYIVSGANRLFFLNIDQEGGGSMIVWSNMNNPHFYNTDNLASFDKSDGQEIKGGIVLGNNLVIFKTHKIFLFDIWNWTQDMVTQARGLLAAGSLQEMTGKNAVIFLDSDCSIVVYDLVNFSDISFNIATYLKLYIDLARVDEICSSYDATKEEYSIIIPAVGGGYVWLSYYFKGDGWTIHTKPMPTSMIVARDDNKFRIVFSYTKGGSFGDIGYGTEEYEDNGDPIAIDVMTTLRSLDSTDYRKTIRACYFYLKSWRLGTGSTADDDLWGYLFTAETNDVYLVTPYATGAAIASSTDPGSDADNAFDSDEGTLWESLAGEGNGVTIVARADATNAIFSTSRRRSILSLWSEYSGDEYIGWVWPATVYLAAVSIVPGDAKDAVIELSTDGTAWETFETVQFDESGTRIDVIVGVDCRGVRLRITSTYGTATASVKEIISVISTGGDMQAYILDKSPKSILRKVHFYSLAEMTAAINAWKAANPAWALTYRSDMATFDIDDNDSIADALGFVTAAQLASATHRDADYLKVLAVVSGNTLFTYRDPGEIDGSFSFFVDQYQTPSGVIIPFSSPGMINVMGRGAETEGYKSIKAQAWGRGDRVSIRIQEESRAGFAVSGATVYYNVKALDNKATEG